MMWLVLAGLAWAGGWWVNARIAGSAAGRRRGGKLAVPVIFGVSVLLVWEGWCAGWGCRLCCCRRLRR